MTLRREWFCTKCKGKFESDHPKPKCPACDSVHVLKNCPNGELRSKT